MRPSKFSQNLGAPTHTYECQQHFSNIPVNKLSGKVPTPQGRGCAWSVSFQPRLCPYQLAQLRVATSHSAVYRSRAILSVKRVKQHWVVPMLYVCYKCSAPPGACLLQHFSDQQSLRVSLRGARVFGAAPWGWTRRVRARRAMRLPGYAPEAQNASSS